MKTKQCSKCKLILSLEEFHVDNKRKSGRTPGCKKCLLAYARARTVRYREANKKDLRWRKSAWKQQGINITTEKYLEMHKEQQASCAICGVKEDTLSKSLFVDHCHETGEIRGLLCYKCNTGIGNLDDNIEILEKAIIYLKNRIMTIFIYDNDNISISITAKNEKEAKRLLKENVINPSLFVKETEMELDDLTID